MQQHIFILIQQHNAILIWIQLAIKNVNFKYLRKLTLLYIASLKSKHYFCKHQYKRCANKNKIITWCFKVFYLYETRFIRTTSFSEATYYLLITNALYLKAICLSDSFYILKYTNKIEREQPRMHVTIAWVINELCNNLFVQKVNNFDIQKESSCICHLLLQPKVNISFFHNAENFVVFL